MATEVSWPGYVPAQIHDTYKQTVLVGSTGDSVDITSNGAASVRHLKRWTLYWKWRGYCEAMFHELVAQAPEELAALIREPGTLAPARLTYAAEALGRAANTDLVTRTLLPLLAHPSPIVREGAILGVGHHLTARVLARLQQLAIEDPSAAVRTTAQELVGE